MQNNNLLLAVFSMCGMGILLGFYFLLFVLSVKPKDKDNLDGVSSLQKQIQTSADCVFKELSILAFCSVLPLGVFVHFLGEQTYLPLMASAVLSGSFACLIILMLCMMLTQSVSSRILYRSSINAFETYRITYQSACVISLLVSSLAILSFIIVMIIYEKLIITPFSSTKDFTAMSHCISGYCIGVSVTSSITSIYTAVYKNSVQISQDLAQNDLQLDSKSDKNPSRISQQIGFLADVLCQCSDSFGNISISMCSVILVSSRSEDLIASSGFLYSFLVVSTGLLLCIVTSVGILSGAFRLDSSEQVPRLFNLQMLLCVLPMLACVYPIGLKFLPASFSIGRPYTLIHLGAVTPERIVLCTSIGIISSYGFLLFKGADSTKGRILVYTIAPCLAIPLVLYACYSISGYLGIASACCGAVALTPLYLGIRIFGSLCKIASELESATNGGFNESNLRDFACYYDFLRPYALWSNLIGYLLCLDVLVSFSIVRHQSKECAVSPFALYSLSAGALAVWVFKDTLLRSIQFSLSRIYKEICEIAQNQNFRNEDYKPAYDRFERLCCSLAIGGVLAPLLSAVLPVLVVGLLFGLAGVCGFVLGCVCSGGFISLCSHSFVAGMYERLGDSGNAKDLERDSPAELEIDFVVCSVTKVICLSGFICLGF